MSRVGRSRIEHLVVEREPVNLSQIAKSARSSTRSQTPQSFSRVLSKAVELSEFEAKQPPFSFRKHSAAPRHEAADLSHYLCKKPSKPLVPSLPLDQVRGEDQRPPPSGLSSINYSIDSAGKRHAIYVEETSKGEDNSLLLSPVPPQKTYSRLDESSIVDPTANIIIEDGLETSLKRELMKLQQALADEKETHTALLAQHARQYEGRLASLQTAVSQQQAKWDSDVRTLREEMGRLRGDQQPKGALKENLTAEYRQALQSKEAQHEEQTRQRLQTIRKEYEVRLRQQQEQLSHVQQHNSFLQEQLAPSRLSDTEQKALRALLEENESLRTELADARQRLLCARCKCEF